MARASWRELNDLYDKARALDVAAWEELDEQMVYWIVRWLKSRQKIRLPDWELQDISHKAFEETTLRMQDIENWPQAWIYTRKSAWTLTIDQLRRRRNATILEGLDERSVHLVDPASQTFVRQIDFCDELEVFLRCLSEENRRTLFVLVEASRQGKLNLSIVAKKLGISGSTLDRRLASMRDFFRLRVNLP